MIGFGHSVRFLATCLVLLALVAFGYFLGQGTQPMPPMEGAAFASPLPEMLVDSAARGKSLSFATGQIEPGVDALFSLDHLTGSLFCFILTKGGALGATFVRNVKLDMSLPPEAETDFVMTTGIMDFGNVGNMGRPANAVVYIGDGNSGRVVAIGVIYNRQFAGRLEKISEMSIRDPSTLRDQGN